MYFKKSLIVLCFFLPAASFATEWTDDTKSKMVEGCVDSITENVVADYKKSSGLSASDSIPAEVQEGLDREIVPELEKTCTCTIDRVAAEHSYEEVESDISIMQRAGASMGTPEGCPLNI